MPQQISFPTPFPFIHKFSLFYHIQTQFNTIKFVCCSSLSSSSSFLNLMFYCSRIKSPVHPPASLAYFRSHFECCFSLSNNKWINRRMGVCVYIFNYPSCRCHGEIQFCVYIFRKFGNPERDPCLLLYNFNVKCTFALL